MDQYCGHGQGQYALPTHTRALSVSNATVSVSSEGPTVEMCVL